MGDRTGEKNKGRWLGVMHFNWMSSQMEFSDNVKIPIRRRPAGCAIRVVVKNRARIRNSLPICLCTRKVWPGSHVIVITLKSGVQRQITRREYYIYIYNPLLGSR